MRATSIHLCHKRIFFPHSVNVLDIKEIQQDICESPTHVNVLDSEKIQPVVFEIMQIEVTETKEK